MEWFGTNTVETVLQALKEKSRVLIGNDSSAKANCLSRIGLGLAGLFLVYSGLWITYFLEGVARLLPITLVFFGIYCVVSSRNSELRLPRANSLALIGHLTALLSFYFFSSRFLTIIYSTDSIVGTYMGIVKTLQGQNPYVFNIKPYLIQFGFPQSLWTPHVDGTPELHLNYPALNFLSLLPLYLAGLRDLRDGLLLFHVASLVLIFYVAPARWKAISIAPFAVGLPLALVSSWTDSVWAFFLILSAVYWYKGRPGLSLVMLGLAGATKQIALVAAPFMLVRVWHESEGSRLVGVLKAAGLMLGAFLVPNIPFIITSPSLWWQGTVKPYLPSGTPLVTEGVGLSEIMGDLGVALSPSVYTLLTALAGGLLFVAYALAYSKLKRYLWAMPVFTLFFYHRSFPNYLAFWVFPLVPELMFYRSTGSFWRLPSLRLFDWRPGAFSLSRTRGRLFSLLMVFLALTGVLTAASGAYMSHGPTLSVDVRVDRLADPDSLGVATQAIVALNNTGTTVVSPSFFAKEGFQPRFWNSNSTAPLLPGRTVHYLITATDSGAAIPLKAGFRFQVFDSTTGALAGQSQLVPAEFPAPRVANPGLKWWTMDPSIARKVPLGWKLTGSGLNEPTSGTAAVGPGVAQGARLRLNYTTTAKGVEQLFLSQTVFFNSTNLTLLAHQSFQTDTSSNVLFGLRFTDGIHVLFFVFSTTVGQKTVASFAENTTTTIPVQASSWAWLSVDPQSEWKAQKWALPLTVDCSILLEAATPGVYYVDTLEVTTALA